MLAILKKEFRSYFLSPIGYTFIGILLLLFNIFFQSLFVAGSTNFEYLFGNAATIVTFMIPVLTMRMFSEERKTGTEQLLLTSPKSVVSIVLGKFFAAACIVLVAELFTLGYFAIIDYFAAPNLLIALATLLGFLLLSLAYISLGMFISTITENQIVCCLVTIVAFLGLWFLLPAGNIFSVLPDFLENYIYGLIPIASIIKFISFIVLFILLSIISLQRKKCIR